MATGTAVLDFGASPAQEASAICPLVCGAIVAGTGFTIFANAIAALGRGTFNVRWAWV